VDDDGAARGSGDEPIAVRLALSLEPGLQALQRALGAAAALDAGATAAAAAPADAGIDEGTPVSGPSVSGDGLLVVPADPWDVPVLVERGVVDCGVVARHILAELEADVVQLADLGIACSRLALVMPAVMTDLPSARRPRIATTHPTVTRRHFARRGRQVELLALRHAATDAVLLGAADAAVVVLGPDQACTAQGLVVCEELLGGGARLIASRSARVVRPAAMQAALDAVRAAAAAGPAAGAGAAHREERHAAP
jgi:ATP phosphoribosyltransferase